MIYQTYRPTKLEDFVGNDSIKEVIADYLKTEEMPHAFMFSGPSGVGKTTLARIIGHTLNVDTVDFIEVKERGIEAVRELEREIDIFPVMSKYKIYLFDEAHRLTDEAKEALLKPTEDIPKHVIFIFCTTEPSKIKKALRDRFSEIQLHSLKMQELKTIINTTLKRAGITLDNDVVSIIAIKAGGSARVALMLAEKVIALDPDRAIQLLKTMGDSGEEHSQDVMDVCRGVLYGSIPEFLAVYNKANISDPERIRYIVLSYLHGCLLKSKNEQELRKFMRHIEPLKESVMYSGKAGLLSALLNSKMKGNVNG